MVPVVPRELPMAPAALAAGVSRVDRGKLPAGRLLTGTLGREDINDGFGRQRTGQAIRQMVTMGD
ncbi:hypothetical protein [Cupriavidus sp. PET2-C1]